MEKRKNKNFLQTRSYEYSKQRTLFEPGGQEMWKYDFSSILGNGLILGLGVLSWVAERKTEVNEHTPRQEDLQGEQCKEKRERKKDKKGEGEDTRVDAALGIG